MLKIGLTGNMGSGKTTIARVFETFGVPVFHSDQEAKKLYNNDYVKQQVSDHFGQRVILANGQINLKELAGIIFTNKQDLAFINNLIHPLTRKRFLSWCEDHNDKPYVMQESALLFETGLYKQFDFTILVFATEEILIQRIMERDGITKKAALDRLRNQMPQEEKKGKANILILNDNTELILPRIWDIHNDLISKRKINRATNNYDS